MKWLNSLDELLYEVMSWLLFFPLTLWRAIWSPLTLMTEVEREATLPDDQQYAAVLSPPLFLALALLLSHTVATALGQTDAIVANTHGLAALVSDTASALILRVIIFAVFPLFIAARLVRHRGARLDRATLRRPFYEQCYPAAVFALGLSLGTSLSADTHLWAQVIGRCLVGASLVNFWTVESLWSARVLGTGIFKAAKMVLLSFLAASVVVLFIGYLFTR